MVHPNDRYKSGDFPWLPGQALVTPNPAYSFRESPEPPRWLMLTLEALAGGTDPDGLPPKAWLTAIKAQRDSIDAMRAFGRECFNVLDIGDGASPNWYTSNGEGVESSILSDRDAWWRIWSGYSNLVLADLNEAQENVGDALKRIPAQWAGYVAERAHKFWSELEGASAWSPPLAIVWILYGGNREAIARYFANSVDRTKFAPVLDWIGQLEFEPDPDAVVEKPADALALAMRRSKSHSERVIMKGLLNGAGMLTTIEPDDLARMHWLTQLKERTDATCILAPEGFSSTNRLPVFSHVVVDRESLCAAFPPRAGSAATPRKALKPETFAADHKARAIERLKSRGAKLTTTAIASELQVLYAAEGGTSTANVGTWERYVRKSG